jgi:hypothetical protein
MNIKKGRECGVCAHPDRASIELGLANRIALRTLSKRYGLSIDAIHRHRHKHMDATLTAQLMTRGRLTEIDLDHLRITESEGILHHLVTTRARLYRAIDATDDAGNHMESARITGILLKNLELTAKLLGELSAGSTSLTVNVLASEEYFGLRVAIMQALKPFPEARAAVAHALQGYESPTLPILEGEVRRVGTIA